MIDYDDWGDKPLPEIDPESEPYWKAAAEGELSLQRCADCGEYQFYPRELCRHCWSRDVGFEAVDGTGTVYSYTTIHRAGQPGYGDEVPYTVALVELDLPTGNPSGRAVRLTTHVIGPPDGKPEIGLPVEVAFRRINDDPPVALPVFRPR